MAKTPIATQPTDQGVGLPPSRPSDIALVEIAKLQSDGEYIKRDLSELRAEVRGLLVQATKLETNISHLPSKEFIVKAVTGSLIIGGAIASALFGLQNYLSPRQITPVATQTVPANPSLPTAPKSP